MTLRDELIGRAIEAGACCAGVTTADPIPESEVEAYRRWIEAGRHGTMDYLAKYDDVRAEPRRLLEGARSVLCTAFSYYTPGQPRSALFADYALGACNGGTSGSWQHTAARARRRQSTIFQPGIPASLPV